MNSSNKNFGKLNIEDVIENKNFVLCVNENLREIVPVANTYATKVTYFKDLSNLDRAEPGQFQLIISHEDYDEIQKLISDNSDVYFIYVHNNAMGSMSQKPNTLIIKDKEIPSLIRKLEGSRKENIKSEEEEQ